MKNAEVASSIKNQRSSILKAVQRALHHPCLKLKLASCLGLVLVPAISITGASSLEQQTVTQPRKTIPLFIEPVKGGIRETIPEKYRKRYQDWKEEFLSTETVRNQWERYAHNTRFLLTIAVSRDKQKGAATGDFAWNESDTLVAATITLGCQIDQGYPEPEAYPVLHSLTLFKSQYVKHRGNILAAAKIAHEFGHLNNVAHTNGAFFRLQNHLIPEYLRIFESNRYNTCDSRLLEMAHRMGGTPVEVSRNREYSGETNALLYLSDKIRNQLLPCLLLTRITQNVWSSANENSLRFLQITESQPAVATCTSTKPQQVARR